MKVKVVSTAVASDLEVKMLKFLESNTMIEIIEVKYRASSQIYSAVIKYNEGSQVLS